MEEFSKESKRLKEIAELNEMIEKRLDNISTSLRKYFTLLKIYIPVFFFASAFSNDLPQSIVDDIARIFRNISGGAGLMTAIGMIIMKEIVY